MFFGSNNTNTEINSEHEFVETENNTDRNDSPDVFDRVDITTPIKKPSYFDDVRDLIELYEEINIAVDELKIDKTLLYIDENPDDENSKIIDLPKQFKTILIENLNKKLKEIREALGYN